MHYNIRPSTYPALGANVFDIISILAFCLTAITHLRHTEEIISSMDISHRPLTTAYSIVLTCRQEAPGHSSLSAFCHNIRDVPCFPQVLCLPQINPCHISSLDTYPFFALICPTRDILLGHYPPETTDITLEPLQHNLNINMEEKMCSKCCKISPIRDHMNSNSKAVFKLCIGCRRAGRAVSTSLLFSWYDLIPY